MWGQALAFGVGIAIGLIGGGLIFGSGEQQGTVSGPLPPASLGVPPTTCDAQLADAAERCTTQIRNATNATSAACQAECQADLQAQQNASAEAMSSVQRDHNSHVQNLLADAATRSLSHEQNVDAIRAHYEQQLLTLRCPDAPTVAHADVVEYDSTLGGDGMTIECHDGYADDGVTNFTLPCTSAVSWGILPSCTSINPCTTDEDDCDEQAECAHTGPGAHTCECTSGVAFGNGQSCSQCSASCSIGELLTAACTSTTDIVCEPIVASQALPEISGASISYDNGFTYPTSATYSCADGTSMERSLRPDATWARLVPSVWPYEINEVFATSVTCNSGMASCDLPRFDASTSHADIFTAFQPDIDVPFVVELTYDCINDFPADQYLFFFSDGTANNAIAVGISSWETGFSPMARITLNGDTIAVRTTQYFRTDVGNGEHTLRLDYDGSRLASGLTLTRDGTELALAELNTDDVSNGDFPAFSSFVVYNHVSENNGFYGSVGNFRFKTGAFECPPSYLWNPPESGSFDTTTFGGLNVPVLAYSSSVVYEDLIYVFPHFADHVLVIDPLAGTTDSTSFRVPEPDCGCEKYWGAVVLNDLIYGMPIGADHVLIINPSTGTMDTTTLATGIDCCGQHRGGVVHDGLIYAMPASANSVLVVDPIAGTFDTTTYSGIREGPIGCVLGYPLCGFPDAKFDGGLVHNNLIYAFPGGSTFVLVINPATRTWERFGELSTSNSWGFSRYDWVGGVLYNDLIYMVPVYAESVLIIDPIARTLDTTTLGPVAAGSWKYWGAVVYNDLIYGSGYGTGNMLVIDPATGTLDTTTFTGLPSVKNCIEHNGLLYCLNVHPNSQSRGVVVVAP